MSSEEDSVCGHPHVCYDVLAKAEQNRDYSVGDISNREVLTSLLAGGLREQCHSSLFTALLECITHIHESFIFFALFLIVIKHSLFHRLKRSI